MVLAPVVWDAMNYKLGGNWTDLSQKIFNNTCHRIVYIFQTIYDNRAIGYVKQGFHRRATTKRDTMW